MVIRNNVAGLRAYNANRKTVGSIKKNLEKLSSGYRINRAADDAAGLGVSQRILAKVTELDRCENNALEGIDLARTADAALQEVNDMLKRARSLCIQAENGTYSDQELKAISEEMNQIFSEIDRISAGSYHNSICLFRGDIGQTYHDEYDEHFNALGPDNLQLWGELDYIEAGDFDPAPPAKPATATFILDDSVDPADLNTLEGKALTIGSYTYYFTKGNTYPSSTRKVAIGNTMEQTLKNLVQASRHSNYDSSSGAYTYTYDLSDASIEDRTVTLTASLRDLTRPVNNIPYTAQDGDAEWAHSIRVTSPEGVGTLDVIDGTSAADNAPVYESPLKLEYNIGKSSTGTLSADDVTNLSQNKFRIHIRENGNSYYTYKDISFSSFNLTANTTWDEFGQKLATAIGNLGTNYSASCNSGKVTITYTAGTTYPTRLYTSVETGSTGGTPSQTLKTWTTNGVSFSVTQDDPGGMESFEKCSVQIPALSNLPFSFSVDGYSHVYYNPNDSEYTQYTNQADVYLSGPYADSTHIVTGSVSQSQVANDILSQVKTSMGSTADVKIEGNKLVVTAKAPGSNSTVYNRLRKLFSPTTVSFSAIKRGTPGTSSKPIISTASAYSNLQKVDVTFDLGSDVKALEGKGFSVGGTRVEFINSDNGGSLRSDYYNDIDLKSLTTMEEVRAAIGARFSSSYTVTLNGSKVTISTKTDSSDYSKLSVTDGVLGMDQLSKGGAVKFDGGEDIGFSQKEIDFSGINEDNLDTLLGKGFRVNCATCSGEFINVFFCWTNDGSVPLAFEKEDPVTGIVRTIHNIPVELSKVTSADKIVQSIVDQVRPSLKHYTDVAVGDPPTTLIAMEKRQGGAQDANGTFYPGSVETGVEANFTYSVAHKLVADLPVGDLDELKTAEVNIYVGSDPEPQVITIHLPYIDLYHLRLKPPELVDLTAEGQDPADWLGRVDRADRAISSARGTIGADYNRLEHAVQDLSNSHIQLSDAYSVIRDTDMAELMMKQVKDQILVQTQQSMLAQANQIPQGVLQLLQ